MTQSGYQASLEQRLIRNAIRKEVELITPLDDIERATKSNALSWIDSGADICRIEKPSTPPIHLVSYFAVIDGELLHDNPMFLTMTETVGKTAGHTDVSIWYTLRGNRSENILFDESEFRSVSWFHKDKVPLERSDIHMGRFLRKPYGQ